MREGGEEKEGGERRATWRLLESGLSLSPPPPPPCLMGSMPNISQLVLGWDASNSRKRAGGIVRLKIICRLLNTPWPS